MSNPNFALYPNNDDVGILQPIIPLGNNLTFARGSNKSRMNELGNIEILDSNRPALNFNNLNSCPKWSFEPTRENLLPYSNTQDFTLTNATRGASQAYNGINGYLYNASGGAEFAARKVTSGAELGYKTFSIFVDITKSSYFTLLFYIDSSANKVSCSFNTTTKTFSTITENNTYWQNSNVKATQLNGNIWRLEITSELILAGTNLNSYVGANTDVTGIWLGGAQLEKGYGATSLIETTGSTLQRLYDSATLGNLQTNGLLGATEGCVYLEFDADSQFISGATPPMFLIGTYGNPNSIYIIRTFNAKDFPTIYLNTGDSTNYSYKFTQQKNKIILNYNSSGIDVWVNGVRQINAIKNFAISNQILTLSGASRQFDLGSIAMYDTKQLDSFCQQLTTL